MRNWHHKILKIEEARNLINSQNKYGNSDIYVGVIEGQIEFEAINPTIPLIISNYKPTHSSFSDINGLRKVFFRNIDNKKYTQKIDYLKPSMHTTCVTGIVSGNINNSIVIDGICPNIRAINSSSFIDALHLTLVNQYSDKNMKSVSAYGTIYNSDLSINGATDPLDIYSDAYVSIINCSFKISNNKLQVDFILRELFAYGRNGRGTLVIVSAGNDNVKINDIAGSSGYRATVYSNKTLIVAASKVKLDFYTLASYNVPNPIFKEEEADYSNYGERIDLCAPSGPDQYPSKDDINIYSPTMINCGDIGTDNQVFDVVISESNNLRKIVLSNIKGVFKGQSIELGVPNSYTHEVRYIDNVKEVDGTNDVEVTLSDPLKYTKNNSNTGNYNIVGTTARLLVFKKKTERYTEASTNILSINKLQLEDLKGIKATTIKPQKVYIYEINSPLGGIYTEITSILNYNTGLVELSNSLPFLSGDILQLIPDQITTSLTCKSRNTTYFSSGIHELDGFFIGQQVLLSANGQDRIASITDKSDLMLVFTHAQGNIGDNYTLKSLSYGDFTSQFTGTSAATPIVSGLAGLILSANENLNAIEIKHILKITADQIGNVTYNDAPSNSSQYNYGYAIRKKYGTGRVNAESAIKLALNWHQSDLSLPLIYPDVPVFKPRMEIADQLSGNSIINVPITDPVDSPDIWVSTTENTLPTPSLPLNTIDTSKNQFIHVKVRNTGNRDSFIESDLRVLIAFTDDENPAFPFPDKWYEQDDVKLLAVKTIPITSASSETVIKIEWNDIATKWNQINSWNPIDSVTGLRKRTYILAHIAPFDGLNSDVQLDNIRNNKQLTCKEIIVTHNGVNDRTAFLPGNKLDITVGQELVSKSFDLSIENILETDLATTKVKATKVNRVDQSEVSVFFSQNTNGDWQIEGGANPDWVTFDAPSEIASQYSGYKYVKFPHTIIADNSLEEIKIETLNA